MNVTVTRTCTAVADRSGEHPGGDQILNFEDLRHLPAYVLLGDPGMGKTTSFEDEANLLGDKAKFISAREFLRSHLPNNPSWRERTLFIDGLDEIRAGAYDARVPFDEIRSRLDQLGKPRFRLSCRASDWLGANDRNKLTLVTPDEAAPTVVVLNPLAASDVRALLESLPGVEDADAFIEQAQGFGVADLLANPQTLELMVKAVAKDGTWPQSRLQTFEMACRQMASETNEEHCIPGHRPNPEEILDAAGRICALLLLSGAGGLTDRVLGVAGDQGERFPELESLGDRPEILRFALKTRLFKSLDDVRFTPVHRHIAEFLGARFLHQTIQAGLPHRRASALMAGYDGRIVTEFRGLSAWLATHSSDARGDLIARDPVGVGLYGDVRNFQVSEKRELLAELNRESSRLPGGSDSYRAFAPLAVPDLEQVFLDILGERSRQGETQAFMSFVLRVLCQGERLPGLVPNLLACVRDSSLWSQIRGAALKALVQHCEDHGERTGHLAELLLGVYEGTIQDSDNELLGILLSELYPDVVSPTQVWEYLRTAGPGNFYRAYYMFWRRHLLAKSKGVQLSELLDCADDQIPNFNSLLHGDSVQLLLLEILERALVEFGDTVENGSLYRWLSGAASRRGVQLYVRQAEGVAARIRGWLEARPDVQKSLILEGLNDCAESDNFRWCATRVSSCLFGATPPDDMGSWSLDQAVSLAEVKPEVAEVLLERAVQSFRRQSGAGNALSFELLKDRCRGSEVLKNHLALLLKPPEEATARQTHWEDSEYIQERLEEKRQWIALLGSHRQSLLENTAPPALLYELARTYFADFFPEPGTDYGFSLLEQDIQDPELAAAALEGIMGTLTRADVPETKDVLRLRRQAKMPYLVLPFLAALHELNGTADGNTSQWDLPRIRKALIFHFSTDHLEVSPWWYQRLLIEQPEIVADMHIEFGTSEFRARAEFVSNISHLAHDPDHDQIARLASVKLLQAFPGRSKTQQLAVLDPLLWAAIRHADRDSLKELVDIKLSRADINAAQRGRWLAASLVISPDKYIRDAEQFFRQRRDRVSGLVDFFPEHIPGELTVPAMEMLVRIIGSTTGPTRLEGRMTRVLHASEIVDEMIRRMAGTHSEEATEALKRLMENPGLALWKDALQVNLERQIVLRRDAHFQYPSVSEIRQALASGTPANAGDLWALLVDLLETLSIRIRTSSTDQWRQYWNDPPKGFPTPRHEEHCRNFLLSDLQMMLPEGVDAQPEGRYVLAKRADIRVSCGDFQVPVEVKRNSDRLIWRAIDDQLIPRYVSAPETGGHGIYLVFWFGEAHMTARPPFGPSPRSAAELKEQLERTLDGNRSWKIAVCVVDVSRPS